MTNIELYDHVQRILKSKGFTPNLLLAECGINKNYFNDLKNKNIKPSVRKFQKISEILGVPLEYLLYGESDKSDTEVEKLIEIFVKLDHKGKVRVQSTAYDELDRISNEKLMTNSTVTSIKRKTSNTISDTENNNSSLKQQA